MGIEGAKINIQPVLTKEQIAYDEASKNMRYIAAKLRISQEGIDTQNISLESLETVIVLFDQMETIQRDFNIDAQKLHQDTNNKIKTLQEDANKKFADVQNRYRKLIDIMKNNVVGGEYDMKDVGITISKEREEEIKKELAEELARSKDTGTDNIS